MTPGCDRAIGVIIRYQLIIWGDYQLIVSGQCGWLCAEPRTGTKNYGLIGDQDTDKVLARTFAHFLGRPFPFLSDCEIFIHYHWLISFLVMYRIQTVNLWSRHPIVWAIEAHALSSILKRVVRTSLGYNRSVVSLKGVKHSRSETIILVYSLSRTLRRLFHSDNEPRLWHNGLATRLGRLYTSLFRE